MDKYKRHIRSITSKYRLQHEMKSMNYLMVHIIYQIFNIVLNTYQKHGKNTVNPSIRSYVNEIESRITYKINTEHYLEILTPGTMKLLGSNKSEINKKENGENVPHL